MLRNVHMGQIKVVPGRPDLNTREILNTIAQTPAGNLVILPEMAVPGYVIGDKWLRDSFVKECRDYNERILEALKKHGNSAIWGNIDYDESKKNNDGSIRKYNTAYVAQFGEMLGKRYKTLLPNYRMFDDKRYFTSLEELAREMGIPLEEMYKPFEMLINGVRTQVGVLICEDIWNINGDYSVDPVAMTKMYNPDLIAVSSCSPFGLDKDLFRKKLLKMHSVGTKLVYVNPIGTQNNGKNIFTFDGGSAAYKNGEFVAGVKDFTTNEITKTLEHKSQIEQIFTTLVYAIRETVAAKGAKKVILGLSGGIDSGVVAALLTIALGKENVIAINMPSVFNSDTTKSLASNLAGNLGIEYKIFSIQEAVDLKVKQMSQVTGKVPEEFEIENIQARERGQILSDLAATYGALFTNNGNKDEVTTGYATLYGDVSGAFSPLGDLYKTQVYDLARYINEYLGAEIIPNLMIDLKPAAELSNKQNPEQGGGDPFDYEFLGKLNRGFIERKMTPVDILTSYQEGTLEKKLGLEKKISEIFKTKELFIQEIEKIWTLFHKSYFKRIQAPGIITISKGSYGFDFRESELCAYFGEKYEEIKSKILAK